MTAPTSPPPTPSPASTFTARTPEDVLAVVPVILGFVPSDSIAMLTFGAGPPFHARIDLPGDPSELPGAVDSLLEPVLRHEARRALFVVYTAEAGLADAAARCLAEAFGPAGVEVVGVLRADGEHWWQVGDGGPGETYDLATHPFSAQAVLDGRVLYGSRDELRANVLGVPDLVAGVVSALAGPSSGPPAPAWVDRLVARHARDRTSPTDTDVARLLRGLLDPHLRDAACAGLTRASARSHVGFWTDVVRRSPDPLVAAPAALLALAAWQDGHGALAWCALDRCTDADPEHPLGALVTRVLMDAVPPAAWGAAG